MKITFVTDGVEVPAARFRCLQFFPYFAAHGIECEHRFAYGHAYNQAIKSPVSSLYKSVCRARRAFYQLSAYRSNLIFLQRTAFPHSGLVEKLNGTLSVPLIFDFDDSLFVDGLGNESPRRRRAFETGTEVADHLIAGNVFLENVAAKPWKTSVIPTVIDTRRYVPRGRTAPRGEKLVIGWMGTSGNFPFLESIAGAIKEVLSAYPNAIFRIVSNDRFRLLDGVARVQQIHWTADKELEWLQSFDIGLMPLIDSPLTRGKCAFKMIQYMSVGVPVVVSPVGANVEVSSHADVGFLAHEPEEWFDAIAELLESRHLRAEKGERGRAIAEKEYSIQAVLPKYLEIFSRFN